MGAWKPGQIQNAQARGIKVYKRRNTQKVTPFLSFFFGIENNGKSKCAALAMGPIVYTGLNNYTN